MISQLLNTLKSGARTNRYRIIIPAVSELSKSGELSQDLNLLCQSTSFPAKTLTPTEVVIKGRKVLLRGETALDGTWDVTFFNTHDLLIRTLISNWMDKVHRNKFTPGDSLLDGVFAGAQNILSTVTELINDPMSALTGSGVQYQRDITIEQMDFEGNVFYKSTLIGAFPISISAIELDDSNTEISKTVVTFAYNDIYIENTNAPVTLDDISMFTREIL